MDRSKSVDKIVVRDYLKNNAQMNAFRWYCKKFGISTYNTQVDTSGFKHKRMVISVPELKLFLSKAQKSVDTRSVTFHSCEGLGGGICNVIALLSSALDNLNTKERKC